MRTVQALTAEEMLDGRLQMVNMGCSSTFHIHHPQSAIKHSLALLTKLTLSLNLTGWTNTPSNDRFALYELIKH
jgi:hypothetical protein